MSQPRKIKATYIPMQKTQTLVFDQYVYEVPTIEALRHVYCSYLLKEMTDYLQTIRKLINSPNDIPEKINERICNLMDKMKMPDGKYFIDYYYQ